MDYCVNNQIFYFNLFNPPKQLKQQTLINQTFNPQASNTYAQTDDKTFVLPYLPVEMQQNNTEKYTPKAALNLFQNCREHRFNCKTSDRPPQRSPDILPLSRGQNDLFKRIQLFFRTRNAGHGIIPLRAFQPYSLHRGRLSPITWFDTRI